MRKNMVRVRIGRKNSFEAAHHLPMMPEGHKCRNTHGHSYELTIFVDGVVGDDGIIVDTAVLDAVFAELHAELDHQLLNDVPGLENPTTEILVVWCWGRVWNALRNEPRVRKVACHIQESPRSTAMYDGP
jgi:6-pyruvoyltetrahydropterin/6-carboxytetrahydropterin synthase